MARPTKYDSEISERICAGLRAGGGRKAVVRTCGISYKTFLRFLHVHEEFEDAVTMAEAQAERATTFVIFRAAMAGDWRAALWWLERRRPEEWGRTLDPHLSRDEVLAMVSKQ